MFDKQPISAENIDIFRHHNFNVMSTLNQFRTNRTKKFHTRTFTPHYCSKDDCDANNGQCAECNERKNGRCSYQWDNCTCTLPPRNPTKKSVHHIIYECKHTELDRKELIRFYYEIPIEQPIGNYKLPDNILAGRAKHHCITKSRQITLNDMLYQLIRNYSRRIDGG